MPTGIEDMLVRLVGRLQIRSRRCVGLFVADAEDKLEKSTTLTPGLPLRACKGDSQVAANVASIGPQKQIWHSVRAAGSGRSCATVWPLRPAADG
jgi:hypothetical protein